MFTIYNDLTLKKKTQRLMAGHNKDRKYALEYLVVLSMGWEITKC